MVDLTTSWLGLELGSPIVVAASPLSDDPDAVAEAVRAGAGAVVMRSLFEEQLAVEQMAAHRFIDIHAESHAEARTFLPDVDVFSLGAEPYLAQLERLRRRVDVPVLASLNGVTPGGWTEFAKKLEAGGASAIELNLYDVVTSPADNGGDVENRQLTVVEAVASAVGIAVSVKLSPFYSSLPAFVQRLETAGARGVVVYNRFYQPDVNLDTLDVDRHLVLSTPSESRCASTHWPFSHRSASFRLRAAEAFTPVATQPRRSCAEHTWCNSHPCCSPMGRAMSA